MRTLINYRHTFEVDFLHRNFNYIRVRSFILPGAPLPL